MKPVSTTRVPDYTFDITIDQIIQITEIDPRQSVARSMAAVLADIARCQRYSLAGHQVMYRDSIGIWDGVQLDAAGNIEQFYLGSSQKTD